MKRVILSADREDALIGIYWYTDDNEVIGVSEPVDNGNIDGQYVQYHNGNHMTLWRQVINDYFDSNVADRIIAKGFKSFYRGRCIYCTMTQTYVVTCSEHLINNREFRSRIKDYFQLDNVRVSFESLNHYRDKLELTGNPAIDDFYFDN